MKLSKKIALLNTEIALLPKSGVDFSSSEYRSPTDINTIKNVYAVCHSHWISDFMGLL